MLQDICHWRHWCLYYLSLTAALCSFQRQGCQLSSVSVSKMSLVCPATVLEILICTEPATSSHCHSHCLQGSTNMYRINSFIRVNIISTVTFGCFIAISQTFKSNSTNFLVATFWKARDNWVMHKLQGFIHLLS